MASFIAEPTLPDGRRGAGAQPSGLRLSESSSNSARRGSRQAPGLPARVSFGSQPGGSPLVRGAAGNFDQGGHRKVPVSLRIRPVKGGQNCAGVHP